MITAKDAKLKADKINSDKVENTISDINRLIEEAVKEGKYYIEYKFVDTDVKMRLLNLGYELTDCDFGMNESGMKISWRNYNE